MEKSEALKLIREALELLGSKYQGADAERMLLAIGYQESGFEHRKQIGGPARGFWQFEKFGGVKGVMLHRTTGGKAREICNELGVKFDVDVVYKSLAKNDLLAACFARLLLWTHPKALPTTEDAAWEYYIETWRPGKPRPEHWPHNWEKSKINSKAKQMETTQLYAIFHQSSLPSGYETGCTHSADEWSKTFIYLTAQQAEALRETYTVSFVGKRPDDRE